ncbi:MAG: iron ABC transporter permease [Chloroflexi bacterium]|nr:iron ABC transporter permease [Chloroflexota bacterium]
MVVLATVPALIILFLLFLTGAISLRESAINPAFTVRHYVELYTDSLAYHALLNTIGFAAVTLAVALFFGVPIAWLVERTDMKARALMYTVMTVGLLVPGFFTAMGWLFLLHPRIGMINQLLMGAFHLQSAPLDILTIPGMGWVQGLGLAALVFVMSSAALRAMDSSLEESAQMSGAGFLSRMRHITLPLAFPAILAAALYVIPIAFSAFDVPLIIGLSNRILTFSTYVYTKTNPQEGLPEYGLPAAFSALMIALGLALTWWYGRTLRHARKYQVVTGKNYRPKLIELGPWKPAAWAFLWTWILLALIIPLLLLIWAALLPYFQPPSLEALHVVSLKNMAGLPWPLVGRGVLNTFMLALLGPTIALAFSLVFSWVVLRWRSKFRFIYDYFAFLPHAVPGLIFAFGALLMALFVIRGPIDLYGTLGLILFVYVIQWIPFGSRMTNGAMIQIHTELEEAAQVSGASTWQTVKRVLVPLLRPALLYSWLFLALFSFRELTVATLLFSPQNITLPVVIWSLFHIGNMAQASAVSLVMMALLVPLVLAYMRLGGGNAPSQA